MKHRTHWSYTSLSLYETCALKYKYRYVDGIKTPMPPSAARGVAIHENAEAYVRDPGTRLESELLPHKAVLDELRGLGAEPEAELWLDAQWRPATYQARWLECKLDALVLYADNTADVIDYKTGKIYDNHAAQMRLYAAAVRAVYNVDAVGTHLVYLDQGETVRDMHKGVHLDAMLPAFTSRANKMLNDTRFGATRGRHCNWCDYNKSKGGPCAGQGG